MQLRDNRFLRQVIWTYWEHLSWRLTEKKKSYKECGSYLLPPSDSASANLEKKKTNKQENKGKISNSPQVHFFIFANENKPRTHLPLEKAWIKLVNERKVGDLTLTKSLCFAVMCRKVTIFEFQTLPPPPKVQIDIPLKSPKSYFGHIISIWNKETVEIGITELMRATTYIS